MRPAVVAALLAIFVATVISRTVSGQVKPATQTLRSAIEQAGFPVPADVAPSDLERDVARTDWQHDATHFIAAIHYDDDRTASGERALHILGISKAGLVARHRVTDFLMEVGWVSMDPRYIFLSSHLSPSAEVSLVLDRSFTLLGELRGYGFHVLDDVTILFNGNMVHFADSHQQTLQAFNPVSRKTTEVFPGAYNSPYGPALMNRITSLLARSDESTRDVLLAARIDVGFDRTLVDWRADPSGRKVVIAVDYHRDRLQHLEWETTDNTGRPMPIVPSELELRTVAVCSRTGADGWRCREQLLADAAKRHRVTLPADNRRESVAKLLDLVLAEQ